MTTLGLVEGMTNAEYHGGDGISKSHLDWIAKSPAHYFATYLDPNRAPRVATPAMVQGTALHTAILEPHLFDAEYAVVPADLPNKPTSRQREAKKPSADTLDAIAAWAEFEASTKGKTILTQEQRDIALRAADSVRKHPRAAAILRKGKAEQTYFAIDPDTGALVKCRPDWETDDGWLADVKSTKGASPDDFYRSVMDFRYFVQAPFYRQVVEAATDASIPSRFEFIAVEKDPPYAVACYVLPDEVLRAGARIARENLQKIVDSKMLSYFPAYSDECLELPFPTWAKRKLGVGSAEDDFT